MPAVGSPRWAVRMLALALAFAAADALSSLTSGPGSGVAGIWIPGGIGLAGLLVGGLTLWPGLVAGGLAAAPAYGAVGAATVPVVAANTVAVVAAAWAIGRLGTDPRLGRLSDVARLAVGSIAGGVPFGVLGVVALLALGPAQEGGTAVVVTLWTLSTVTGFVVVGAALAVLILRRRERMPGQRVVEVVVGLALAAGLAAEVFVGGSGALMLPLFLVVAVVAGRGGPRAAALVSLTLFGFAASSVLAGGGPFGGEGLEGRSLTYQTAALAMALGVLLIGAIGSGEPGSAPGTPGAALAFVMLAGAGAGLGLSEAVVTPELITRVPKPQVTLVSMLVALVIVVGALAGTGMRAHVSGVRSASRSWWVLVVLAGAALFGTEELFLLSLADIEVTRALVLASLAPIMLLVLGLARGDLPLSWRAGAALVLVLAGFYAVTPGEGWLEGTTAAGVWLGVGSSACAAVLVLALAGCRRSGPVGPTVAGALMVSSVGAAILCAALGVLPGPSLWGSEAVIGGIAYVGVLGALLPLLASTWALPRIGALRVSLFEVLSPIIGVVAALAWSGGALDAWQAAGILLLATGLVIGARLHATGH